MKHLPAPTADTPTLADLRRMFAVLPADRTPRWGRMNAAQMLRHCHAFHELCLGRIRPAAPIRWLARWLGPLFLRRLLAGSPTAAPRNLQTLPALRMNDDVDTDLEALRADLLASLDEVAALAGETAHPLYGRMRATDVQTLARHHLAHHANQFGLLDAAPAAASPA